MSKNEEGRTVQGTVEFETTAVEPQSGPLSRGGDPGVGSTVGQYVLESQIASSGGGVVYRAEHRVLGRKVAVKLLHPELAGKRNSVERFIREARAVNLIKHPNIIDVTEFGFLPDGIPFYVMELLEGMTFRELVASRGPIPAPEVLALLEPVCGALAAAHAAGIVHRDLKAANVFLARQPDGRDVVKVLDFGIAKLLHPDPGSPGLTAVGSQLGTLIAMAPEQIRGESIDERTDVYALGVLTFQLLTGVLPFRSDRAADLERMHLEQPPPIPSTLVPLPPAVDAVVLRCLEKSQAKRHPSVPSFLEEFRNAIAGAMDGDAVRNAHEGGQAVAIHFEVRLDEDQLACADDEILFRLGELLDVAESALREAGFALALQTGNLLLGVQPLAADPAAARAGRQAAITLARSLDVSVRERFASMPVRICAHAGHGIVRPGIEGRDEVVGGPILAFDSWGVPAELATGAFATRDALDGLPIAATDGSWTRLTGA